MTSHGHFSCTACRYRQADKTCLITAANSVASEARQVDVGISAAPEFQASQYSILLKVTLPIGSATQIELCKACHKVFCHCNEAVCGQGSPVKATLHLALIHAKRQSMPSVIFCVRQLTRFLTVQTKCVQHISGCPMSSGMHICAMCKTFCEKRSKDSCCVAAKL